MVLWYNMYLTFFFISVLALSSHRRLEVAAVPRSRYRGPMRHAATCNWDEGGLDPASGQIYRQALAEGNHWPRALVAVEWERSLALCGLREVRKGWLAARWHWWARGLPNPTWMVGEPLLCWRSNVGRCLSARPTQWRPIPARERL